MELSKGDKLYYARVLSKANVYELIDLKVITVNEKYFTTTENKTKRMFTFNHCDLEKHVFTDRKIALDIVKNAEKNKPKINEESYYEEY